MIYWPKLGSDKKDSDKGIPVDPQVRVEGKQRSRGCGNGFRKSGGHRSWAWLCLLLLLPACGKKTRVPPVPPPAAKAPPDVAQPAPAPFPEGPVIRVLLREGFDQMVVEGSTRAERVTVKVQGTRLRLTAETAGEVRGTDESTGFRLDAVPGSFLRVDGRLYRGAVEIFVNPLGAVVAVNELSVEEYLYSVVPDELNPKGFPQVEALKAQAIAARTFAVSHLGAYARRGFDVYADERSQVYSGVASEQPLSRQAVDETRGIVATYEGEPIVAMYSSTCGGMTEDFHLIFKGEPIPYLKGGVRCSDSSSRFSTWRRKIRIEEIQPSLDRLANVGPLQGLVPLRKGASERIVEMKFIGTRGERVLRGNDLRAALGLHSNLIVELETRLDEAGNVTELLVEGKGWGHGVGLCQIGAVELAGQGRSAEEILKHYYHGIELHSWY